MDALSNFLGRELVNRITAKREAYLAPLIGGQAADYPDYRARASYLRALADVLTMIEDINLEEHHGPFSQHEGGSRRTA